MIEAPGTAPPSRRARPTRFAEAAWASLRAGAASAEAPPYEPATLRGLPAPAQRYLTRTLPAEVGLSTVVELDMHGEIKLGGRWLRFTARQILRAGVGFVWAPVVGRGLIRFVGADVLGPDGARTEFRLHGRVPVVRGTGDDIGRSSQGRLAAETVAWLPQALTPQAGARWVGIDDERAVVTINAAGDDVDVEVAIDDDGQIRWLGLERWKDSAIPPAYASFGGSVTSTYTTANGVRIAGSGTVGWDWHTSGQAAGSFFRYHVTAARFPATPTKPGADPDADTRRVVPGTSADGPVQVGTSPRADR